MPPHGAGRTAAQRSGRRRGLGGVPGAARRAPSAAAERWVKGLRGPGGPNARYPLFSLSRLWPGTPGGPQRGLHPGLALSLRGVPVPSARTPPPSPPTPVLSPSGGPGLWSTLFLHLGARRRHTLAPCTYPGAFFFRKPHASSQPRERPPLRRPLMVTLLGPRCPLPSPGLPLPRPPLLGSGLRRDPGARDTCLFPAFAGRFAGRPA